jgi:hypothetical protein
LWVSWGVREKALRRADHSSRRVLPTVVCRCVWTRKPQAWGGHDQLWVAAPQKKIIKKLRKDTSCLHLNLSKILYKFADDKKVPYSWIQ